MKRFIPLWITALGGFVLIVAYFIPLTQDWGEKAAIWFDILAAIAFVLGGGNLLKIHLKKVSDKGKGWGYSVITAGAFIVMLYVGLSKWGAPPAHKQEYYGQTFAHLSVESIPDTLVFSVEGSIPQRTDDEKIHASVRSQISEQDGEIRFRGWIRRDQKAKLLEHDEHLQWQCNVETLYASSQATGALDGAVAYYSDHEALSFLGHMTQAQKYALLAFNGDGRWVAAVNELYDKSQPSTSIIVGPLPPFFKADNPTQDVTFDASTSALTVAGPLTNDERDALEDLFPVARPLDGADREGFLAQLQAAGPIDPQQEEVFNTLLDGSWSVAQLQATVDAAGAIEEKDRTACEMIVDQEAGLADVPTTKMVGNEFRLNSQQLEHIAAFGSDDTIEVGTLLEQLATAGDFKQAQEDALTAFAGSLPTIGERNKALAVAMMQVRDADENRLPLNQAQRDFLLSDYRAQAGWAKTIGELFISAHEIKYPWSGEYRAQGAPFWWLYEYVFKPLQATIFAMLAFYVASAAFRAFRAKNIEASLLLGTAFIILLGRTFAGVFLTSWMPEAIGGLKIENLTVYIMQVFNTAGNRAIMIGIALGIASTSLKVLLGVDRSYLGSGDE